MSKKLLLIVGCFVFTLLIVLVLYNKWSRIWPNDSIEFIYTDSKIKEDLKIHASFEYEDYVEYRNGNWYREDSTKLKQVFDGDEMTSFNKHYSYCAFYITYRDSVFLWLQYNKPSPKHAHNIFISLTYYPNYYFINDALGEAVLVSTRHMKIGSSPTKPMLDRMGRARRTRSNDLHFIGPMLELVNGVAIIDNRVHWPGGKIPYPER